MGLQPLRLPLRILNNWTPKHVFRHLVLAACLLLLSGCGIIDYFFLPPPEDTAQEALRRRQRHAEEELLAGRPVLYKAQG